MNFKFSIPILFLSILTVNCNQEYNCSNVQIQPAFIGFDSSDIATFVLREFKTNDNYQDLIDTFIVNENYSAYKTSDDTTTVFVDDESNDGKAGILTGHDWQIYIPSTNQTFTVSNIVSENNTGKCGSLDKFNCICLNRNFSANYNNMQINFSNSVADSGQYYIYIHR